MEVEIVKFVVKGEKEEFLLSPMTKAPTPAEHKQRHKKVRLHRGCGPT